MSDGGGGKETIIDPWHSRPIGLVTWTEDADFLELVSEVWQEVFADSEGQRKPGGRPKLSREHQLRIVLVELYRAWLEDPDLCLGMAFAAGAWNSGSRYNPQRVSKGITDIVRQLEAAGLVRVSPGSWGGSGARGNRTSRIQASHRLQQQFEGPRLEAGAIHQVRSECVILKGDAAEGEEAGLIEYEDTDDTRRMRAALEAYNSLIEQTFIDIPVLEEPWITRKNDEEREFRVPIDRMHQFTRRIFSRGSWERNGRFYGPWWQQIGSDHRSRIFINDTPTVEIDFKALHLNILAAETGESLPEDPYLLPQGQFIGIDDARQQREVMKSLVLTALNARSLPAACKAFRSSCPKGHPGRHLKDGELKRALKTLKQKIPWLGQFLCSDTGIRLLNVASRIMALVIERCTRAGIPVLTVHDSVIVAWNHDRLLAGVMQAAAREVVGRELPVEQKHPGWQSVLDEPEHVRLEFIWRRETARSEGYLGRLAQWEKQQGRAVVPWRMKRKEA